MVTPSKYEVIIVGGGPGGSTLGTVLARNGLSVLIVEKKAFPRPKACGGLLSAKSVRLIQSLFGQEMLLECSCAAAVGCRIFYKGQLVAESSAGERMVFVDRSKMDSVLLTTARNAGCDVWESRRVVAASTNGPEITLDDGSVLKAPVIVGADGARSIVRQKVGFRNARVDKMGFGLVTEVPVAALDPSVCPSIPEIHFGLVSWGYGWVFPKGQNVSIGIGGLQSRNPNLRDALDMLLRMRSARAISSDLDIRGAFVPFGDFLRTPASENILLVGDSAGLVEPVTGEGISFALESGLHAASAILKSRPIVDSRSVGRMYVSLYRKSILPHLREASYARWFLFPRCCLPLAMKALKRDMHLVDRYLDIMAGTIGYGEFFRELMWYRLARGRRR